MIGESVRVHSRTFVAAPIAGQHQRVDAGAEQEAQVVLGDVHEYRHSSRRSPSRRMVAGTPGVRTSGIQP
jgi:hypothetical protein